MPDLDTDIGEGIHFDWTPCSSFTRLGQDNSLHVLQRKAGYDDPSQSWLDTKHYKVQHDDIHEPGQTSMKHSNRHLALLDITTPLMSISGAHKGQISRLPPPKSFIPAPFPPSARIPPTNTDNMHFPISFNFLPLLLEQQPSSRWNPFSSCLLLLRPSQLPIDPSVPIPACEPVHSDTACHKDESKCRERDRSVGLEYHQGGYGGCEARRLGDGKASQMS